MARHGPDDLVWPPVRWNRVVSCLWVVAAVGVGWTLFTLPPREAVDQRDARWYAAGSVGIAFPLYLGFLKTLGMSTNPWYYLLPLALTASALDVLGGVMAGERALAGPATDVPGGRAGHPASVRDANCCKRA